jgi:tetratricopeptide (TPR) repeat protein
MDRRSFMYWSIAAMAGTGLAEAAPTEETAAPEQLYRWATANLRAGLWYRRAAGFLAKAVEQEPGEPRYREALACAYFDRALEINLWWQMRRLPGARVSLPWRPEYGPAPGVEALESEAREAAGKAVAEIGEAVRLAPEEAEIHHTRGWILAWAIQERPLLQVEDLEAAEAVEAFEAAAHLQPEEARFHRSMGDALRMVTPYLVRGPGGGPEACSVVPSPAQGVACRLDPRGWSLDELALMLRALDAYERASVRRPSDPFLHYLLYGLYRNTAGEPEHQARAVTHLEAARRALSLNGTVHYEMASVLYRLAAGAPPADARGLKTRALQALVEGNRSPAMNPVWLWPEYPPLMAIQMRRMPYQDLVAQFELHGHLRSLARDGATHASELREAGDARAAVGVLEEVARVGERLIGDPRRLGPPEDDGLLEKLVGIAVVLLTLKTMRGLYLELNDGEGARRTEERGERLRVAREFVLAHTRARQAPE